MHVFGNPHADHINFVERLTQRFQARYGLMWVQTDDNELFYRKVKEAAIEGDYSLYKWNTVEGLLEMGLNMDTVLPVGEVIEDPTRVMAEVLRRTDELSNEIFVMEGMNDFIDYPTTKALIQKMAADLPRSNRPSHVIFLSPEAKLNRDTSRYVDVMGMPKANLVELGEVLLEVQHETKVEMHRDTADAICKEARGLTLQEARGIFRLVGIQTGFDESSIEAVAEERDRIARKMEYLDLKESGNKR